MRAEIEVGLGGYMAGDIIVSNREGLKNLCRPRVPLP
jgi:hypothetical protein